MMWHSRALTRKNNSVNGIKLCIRFFFFISFSLFLLASLTQTHTLCLLFSQSLQYISWSKYVAQIERQITKRLHTNQICIYARDNNGSYLNRTWDHYEEVKKNVVGESIRRQRWWQWLPRLCERVYICMRVAVSIKLTSTRDDDFAGSSAWIFEYKYTFGMQKALI